MEIIAAFLILFPVVVTAIAGVFLLGVGALTLYGLFGLWRERRAIYRQALILNNLREER